MTETSRTILDIYQVRKTRKQKAAFRAWAKETIEAEGYTCHEEKAPLGAVNLVVGDPETARVVYTAHYDTCARLPFPNFITPTNLGIYLLYQLALTLGILLLPSLCLFILGTVAGVLGAPMEIVSSVIVFLDYVCIFGILALMLVGPANRHTANDNTSGVTTLFDILHAMPPELRGEVSFIFFDLEEAGLFGSAGYASKHKKAMGDKPVINFDCVSDGDTILFAVGKKAARHAPALEAAFPSADGKEVKVLTKGTFYPSDQAQFPGGVGVAALKKTRRGLLYMNRIHTKNDIIFQEENIAFLAAGSVRLAEVLTQKETEPAVSTTFFNGH